MRRDHFAEYEYAIAAVHNLVTADTSRITPMVRAMQPGLIMIFRGKRLHETLILLEREIMRGWNNISCTEYP